jgi:hypothetical protein
MKDKFNVPFILSDRFWNMLTKPGLFGKEKDMDGYFYISYKDIDEHFAYHYDNMFLSNDTEMFGKAWALQYAYYFLHEKGLINDEYYNLMSENIAVLKNQFMKLTDKDLWKMSFVFQWPHLYCPDLTGKEVFISTFSENRNEFAEKVENYLNLLIIPDRLKMVIEKRHAKSYVMPDSESFDDSYDDADNPQIPYVKEMSDVGRNDPCPCGSGKKYKKCCLTHD